jgi:hypothetical protein
MTIFSKNELEIAAQGYREPEFGNVSFLEIQSYSEHPEVNRAADLLVQKFIETRQQVRNLRKYPRDAKKLVASIWLHKNLFRFTSQIYRNIDENAVFYTINEDENPIYSYIETDHNNIIINIAEKIKISNKANTGIYCFKNIDELNKYSNRKKGINEFKKVLEEYVQVSTTNKSLIFISLNGVEL